MASATASTPHHGPFSLHPLDFPLDPLSQLTSAQLALVQYHPDASEDIVDNAYKVFIRRREKERGKRVYDGSLDAFHLIDLSFALSDLPSLTSQQLAAVQFHPDSEKWHVNQAEKVFMRRREKDFARGLTWLSEEKALPVASTSGSQPQLQATAPPVDATEEKPEPSISTTASPKAVSSSPVRQSTPSALPLPAAHTATPSPRSRSRPYLSSPLPRAIPSPVPSPLSPSVLDGIPLPISSAPLPLELAKSSLRTLHISNLSRKEFKTPDDVLRLLDSLGHEPDGHRFDVGPMVALDPSNASPSIDDPAEEFSISVVVAYIIFDHCATVHQKLHTVNRDRRQVRAEFLNSDKAKWQWGDFEPPAREWLWRDLNKVMQVKEQQERFRQWKIEAIARGEIEEDEDVGVRDAMVDTQEPHSNSARHSMSMPPTLQELSGPPTHVYLSHPPSYPSDFPGYTAHSSEVGTLPSQFSPPPTKSPNFSPSSPEVISPRLSPPDSKESCHASSDIQRPGPPPPRLDLNHEPAPPITSRANSGTPFGSPPPRSTREKSETPSFGSPPLPQYQNLPHLSRQDPPGPLQPAQATQKMTLEERMAVPRGQSPLIEHPTPSPSPFPQSSTSTSLHSTDSAQDLRITSGPPAAKIDIRGSAASVAPPPPSILERVGEQPMQGKSPVIMRRDSSNEGKPNSYNGLDRGVGAPLGSKAMPSGSGGKQDRSVSGPAAVGKGNYTGNGNGSGNGNGKGKGKTSSFAFKPSALAARIGQPPPTPPPADLQDRFGNAGKRPHDKYGPSSQHYPKKARGDEYHDTHGGSSYNDSRGGERRFGTYDRYKSDSGLYRSQDDEDHRNRRYGYERGAFDDRRGGTSSSGGLRGRLN